jgi:hypothetical protein
MRVDRLVGEHGLGADTAANRQEFERRMEARRMAATDPASWVALRREWCLGSLEYKHEMPGQLEGKLGEHHSGELRLEVAEIKAERILAEELGRLGWQEMDLTTRRKSDPDKLVIAARLRRETTLSIRAIAARVQLGSSKSANARLHQWMAAPTNVRGGQANSGDKTNRAMG